MRKPRFLFLLALCLPFAARAYDAASLAKDAAAFVEAESLMHRNLAASAASLRKSQPLMVPGDAIAASADLSLGLTLAPAYAYRDRLGTNGLFSSFADPADGAGASLAAPSLGASVALPSGLGLTLNISCLPPLALDGTEKALLRIGTSGYWRLLGERFYSVGVLAGGGATWVRGTEKRAIAASYKDASSSAAFSGELASEWNCGVFDLELFVHKTFFVINFYTRANASLVLGSSSSTLRGKTTVGGAASTMEYSVLLDAPAQGLVLAGGMELILGELKIAAEAGRDWLSGTLYGSLGLRYGM